MPTIKAKFEEQPISSLLQIHPRFMRSAHLERDIQDPRSSQAYILTPVARQALERITEGFLPNSTQRAWRIAGDYGSGKTDFSLALARVAKGAKNELPNDIRKFVGRTTFFPAMATGDNEPLGITILRALNVPWEHKRQPSTEDVLVAVRTAVTKARKRQHGGLLLILDELGKNLEYAARNPEHDDIFLLQRLAEEASRSGEKAFIVVAMLHQGVAAYASGLDSVSKREWDKVAGRFEEIIYAQPTEQVAALVAATLNVQTDRLPQVIQKESHAAMRAALTAGLYGSVAAESLLDLSAKIFPLHPTVLPILIRTMRKFGQNERSLFSFISSGEPLGLQHHITRKFGDADYYRMSNLFDYVRSNLLPTITAGNSFTHWGVIEAVLASTAIESPAEDAVLKSIAMLSLLDAPDLPSTEEAIKLAIGGNREATTVAINNLRVRGVVYERGTVRGLCLWPHTSVNLDETFTQATEVTSDRGDGIRGLCDHIQSETLVPRAYYTETGTLRYADVQILSVVDLEARFANLPKLDGKGADLNIYVALPVDVNQYNKARKFLIANSEKIPKGSYITLAVPQGMAIKAMADLIAWKWVKDNVPTLSGDRYAREEVTRQINLAEKQVRAKLGGIDNLAVSNGKRLDWFYHGAESPLRLLTGRELLTFLGEECRRIYTATPRILNELINRRSPSSAAVGARTKLVEAMTTSPEKPNLGLDITKRPPEMALYLSILQHGGFHVETETGWMFRSPKKRDDHCNLLPALDLITKTLQAKGIDVLIPLPEIFEALSRPPFGIREGLQPFIVAIYLATHHQRVALYEDGTYLHEVGGEAFLRLMKEPQYFHLQYCELDIVRAEVLNSLLTQLQIDPRDASKTDLLDLIRPLAIFISREVPEYARKTHTLSATASTVRAALLDAREPIKLVFTTLPSACGLPPIDKGGLKNPEAFAAGLKNALHEIRTAYPNLIQRLSNSLTAAFKIENSAPKARENIMDRAAQLGAAVTEPTLKAFALRLSDKALGHREWVESIANLLARKSPERWTDKDEMEFNHQLELASAKFLRTEMALIGTTKKLNGHACRIAITKSDGTEMGELINWDGMDDARIATAEIAIQNILTQHGRYGMAAAMRAIWDRLESESNATRKV
ncbi:hypothetical protein RGU70_02820 [Herbaspirillum sp. RTI4]|uniref:hypothetical protein n=1 Tax=Herbaspirillum sp. RTI4 TaxID=3048640 RepID=UPI002AB38DB6|nr:hypothetical protein [Herbaspirillum sp. RTI4]MDY7577262.1 hypothetical protein [Herbaspirillum sp. RTI4]MEA9980552.1 hypothetical protein [Herbaspirillum sp. RTI4]